MMQEMKSRSQKIFQQGLNDMGNYKNPVPTVDIIIQIDGDPEKIVLIERKNKPFGWALPGGFVDYGETLESAAVREAREETSLDVTLIRQFHSYSDPLRDSRQHTITTVFIAKAAGQPRAADDARKVLVCNPWTLPEPMAFDHRSIIDDYINKRY